MVLLLLFTVALLLFAAAAADCGEGAVTLVFKLNFWKSFEKSPNRSFCESLAGRWGGAWAGPEAGMARGGWNCTYGPGVGLGAGWGGSSPPNRLVAKAAAALPARVVKGRWGWWALYRGFWQPTGVPMLVWRVDSGRKGAAGGALEGRKGG